MSSVVLARGISGAPQTDYQAVENRNVAGLLSDHGLNS